MSVGTRLKNAVLKMNKFKRILLCTHVLTVTYMTGVVSSKILKQFCNLKAAFSETTRQIIYGFLYYGSDPKNVTIHAAIQMAVLPSFKMEVPMVACFGPNSRPEKFKEIFISGELKNNTYFLF